MGNWVVDLAALCDVGYWTTGSTFTGETQCLQLISIFEVEVIPKKSADTLIKTNTRDELLINEEDKNLLWSLMVHK